MTPADATLSELTWLEEAIAIATVNFVPDPANGIQTGGPFGALVVKDGVILGASGNSVTSTNDPTAHAEINAIRAAAAAHGSAALIAATVISSCEPCPMCLGAAEAAGIVRVVAAATRDDAARGGFDDAEFYAQLELSPEFRAQPLLALQEGSAHYLTSSAGHAALSSYGEVGAVILKRETVVGAGRDETADGKDPTAYSVIRAIQMAGGVLGAFDLSGCALLTAAPLNYLEAGAFMWSRLDHTLYATSAEVAASLGLTVQPQRLGEKPSLVPVQVQVANAFAPFAAWLAQTQRILY